MKDEDRTKEELINELIEVRQRIAELGKSKTGPKRTQEARQESEELYPHTHSLNTITSLKAGDHLCCLYETEEEHRSLLTPFLRQGLERGEKVLYIVDAHTADTVLEYLRDDGLEVTPYLASGQLGILTGNDVYLVGGVFDPDGMIGLLRSETGRALAEGYGVLRITGEMTWALRGLLGSERLIEYESKLNTFFPGSKCLAICQYDRRRFNAEVLLDVLATHPIAIVGAEVYDNFYYMPPGDLLGPDRPAATLRGWLESLAERKRVEEALQESEEKYRILVEQSLQGLIVAQDEPLRIVFANPTCTEITGYSVQELLSLSPDKVQILVHPEDRALILDRLRDRLAGRPVPSRYECRILRNDGTVRWMDVFSSRIEYSKEPAVQVSLIDITERKLAEEALQEREKELELQTINLEEANTALKVLLKRHEEDKKDLEERIMSNVKELVFPCMERLRTSRLDARQTAYVDILTSYINDLISPFAHSLSSSYYNLTFKEIQVASLVREGKTNKEIAELLNISTRTVKFHRDNLRKKLGLRNKKTNLRSHLLSLP